MSTLQHYFEIDHFQDEFFTLIGGAVSFDSAALRTERKGLPAMQRYLSTMLAPDVISDLLPGKATWYISDDSHGLRFLHDVASSSFVLGGDGNDLASGGDGEDLLVGGIGNDVLAGGGGVDYLIGGTGKDTLSGGLGNDTLAGGAGADLYFLAPGDGNDVILDYTGDGEGGDGAGYIRYDDKLIADAYFKLSTSQWRSSDGQYTYSRAGSDLLITVTGRSDSITIKNFDFDRGSLGIKLGIQQLAQPLAPPSDELFGDLQPIDSSPSTPGIQTYTDAIGNVVVDPNIAELNRADTLYGSNANDVIRAGGGDDQVDAKAGDDRVEAGDGLDIVDGRAGRDTLVGGNDSDVLAGDEGEDHIYAQDEITVAAALAQNAQSTGSGQRGDWLDGGADNDVLIGFTGNDAIMGGGGEDLLIGGASDDTIRGDDVRIALIATGLLSVTSSQNRAMSAPTSPGSFRHKWKVPATAEPTPYTVAREMTGSQRV